MLSWLWHAALALIGLLLVRAFIYPRQWGHRNIIGVVVAGAGLYLALQMALSSGAMKATVAVLSVMVLLPYGALAIAALERKVKKDLRALAAEWNTPLVQAPGSELFGVACEKGGRAWWVGNVLTRARSLHPGVRKTQTWRMLAYVLRPAKAPPFTASIMKGWREPKYLEREWRETTVMQGDFFAMSFDGFADEAARGRETGAKAADLRPAEGLADPRLQVFTIGSSDPERFQRVFDGDLISALAEAAGTALQFELNVTPTSINIYHVYAPSPVQRRNLALLDMVAGRIESVP